jgi:hypothetical protein
MADTGIDGRPILAWADGIIEEAIEPAISEAA